MNREQEMRRLRAGAFMVNNGRVLMTINLLREKYNAFLRRTGKIRGRRNPFLS